MAAAAALLNSLVFVFKITVSNIMIIFESGAVGYNVM